jgi:hypothetical protein
MKGSTRLTKWQRVLITREQAGLKAKMLGSEPSRLPLVVFRQTHFYAGAILKLMSTAVTE